MKGAARHHRLQQVDVVPRTSLQRIAGLLFQVTEIEAVG
jgi:hypothetical protein